MFRPENTANNSITKVKRPNILDSNNNAPSGSLNSSSTHSSSRPSVSHHPITSPLTLASPSKSASSSSTAEIPPILPIMRQLKPLIHELLRRWPDLECVEKIVYKWDGHFKNSQMDRLNTRNSMSIEALRLNTGDDVDILHETYVGSLILCKLMQITLQ